MKRILTITLISACTLFAGATALSAQSLRAFLPPACDMPTPEPGRPTVPMMRDMPTPQAGNPHLLAAAD